MASIGSVYYDVLPNLDGFAAKVAAGLGSVKPVKVKVDVDNSSAAKTTAVAQRAAAQQTAIAQRAAAQQAAIRTRAAAQQALLAQRVAAQQAAVQARASAAADKAAQKSAAVAQKAAQAQITAAQKAAAAKASAEGRKTTVAGNLAELDKAARSTERLTAAESRLVGAQGSASLAARRLAEAQADHARDSVKVIASQEAYARSLRAVGQAEQAVARDAAKGQAAGSLTGKINTGEVQQVGTNFLRAGAAIGVGVGLAVRASANFESAMSGVASTGNYTSGQLELLSKAAIAGGQATKYSATEAAEGEAELVKAGLSVQQVLGGGLTGALNLAAAGNLSVADSASAMATSLNQFGLSGADAVHVADRFVQVAGIAQGETSDVAEAFKNGAVTAKQYGLSVDDAATVTAAFAKNGITGAQAGTLLKSSLTNLYAPTGNVQKALDKLGVSAYDAAGNALPVADVAEQLKSKLAGLDEEAKNNALARIFGKETLQGGAILAQQGAAGLAAIRSELDQFPTAAETAATKMDNLKGDVEQLSGALETGLIKSGSGSNDFLRDLAKGATTAVNGFTNLPSAAQKGALGFAAVTSGALLAGGAAIKLVSSISSASAALTTLGASGSKVPGVLGGIGKAAGVAVVALLALNAAGAIADQYRDTPKTLGDAGQAVAGLATQAGAAAPAVESFFQIESKSGFEVGGAKVDGLADAFEHLNATQGGAGGVFDKIASKIPGVTRNSELLATQFGQLDQVLTNTGATSGPQAAAAFSKIAATAKAQQVPLDKLVALFPQYKQQLQDQASALGVTVPDSAAVYADWMGGKVPEAVLAAAKANPQAAASFGVVAQEADRTSKGLDSAVVALNGLVNPQKISGAAAQELGTKLFGSAQAAIGAADAQIAYANAVKQAKASTGGGIDPKSDKGAANLSLLGQQASAYQAVATSQIAAGKSAGQVAAGAREARSAFIDNATAMGVSSGKAADLADKYGLIPKNIETKIRAQVEADAATQIAQLKQLDGTILTPKIQALIDQGKYGAALKGVKELQKTRRAKVTADADTKGAEGKLKDAAKSRAAKLKAQADGIGAANAKLNSAAKGRKATIKAVSSGTGGVEKDISDAARGRRATVKVQQSGVGSVQGAINGIKGKTVNVIVRTSRGDAEGGTITAPGRAIGGTVPGNGKPKADDVYGIDRATGKLSVMVSSGEEVINKAQSDANRAQLKRINAGGKWDIIPRRARGGTLDGSSSGNGRSAGPMRPIAINIDLGRELGGVRTIVVDEVAATGEYAATLTRMGGNR